MVLVTCRRPLLHTNAASLSGLDVGGANDFEMKEYKAKTLIHKGEPVAENMLANGIFICGTPQLLAETATIDGLKRYAELFDKGSKIPLYPKQYFDNLAECELVDVTVIVHEKSDEK